mmetsp:Transcript_81772/g.144339  ORF Transcript_81772/g.144339 Transcript_81772/m.144339 type:complete len:670 (+) Transcript_81772:35-2044(+)
MAAFGSRVQELIVELQLEYENDVRLLREENNMLRYELQMAKTPSLPNGQPKKAEASEGDLDPTQNVPDEVTGPSSQDDEELDQENTEALGNSLKKAFEVTDPGTAMMIPYDLVKVLEPFAYKFPGDLDEQNMAMVITELTSINDKLEDKAGDTGAGVITDLHPVLAWTTFERLMAKKGLDMHASENTQPWIECLQSVIHSDQFRQPGGFRRHARQTNADIMIATDEDLFDKTTKRILMVVQVTSVSAVILSFVVLGVQLDNDPEDPFWLALEVLFAAVFLVEAAVNIYIRGMRGYFCGRNALWNIFDFTLTCLVILGLILTLAEVGEGPGRVLVINRGLRLVRLAKVMKLADIPFFHSFANLLSGLVVGLPWLIWVLLLLGCFIYVSAVMLRSFVLAVVPGDILDVCGGSADSIAMQDFQTHQGICKPSHMYAAEYCPNVSGCMLTIFRCAIGDCTSQAGRSLTAILSDGWGFEFDFFYAISMTCITFGLFNIITAMFIEATLSGLRKMDEEVKTSRLTDGQFLSRKIKELAQNITKVAHRLQQTGAVEANLSEKIMRKSLGASKLEQEVEIKEDEFNKIVRLQQVRALLSDLDIDIEPRVGVYKSIGKDNGSTMTISELITRLLRLRGQLHKSDIVSMQYWMQRQGFAGGSGNVQDAKAFDIADEVSV